MLLESINVDSSFFHFSCKREIFSSSKLKENLVKIISCVDKLNIDFDTTTKDTYLPVSSTVPIEKLNREKERLSLLLANESKKVNKTV